MTYWLIISISLGALFVYFNNKKKFISGFYNNLTDEQLAKETIIILDRILGFHNEQSDFKYAPIHDYFALKQIINRHKEVLSNTNFDSFFDLRNQFAPTGLFQELSIQNSWTEDYNYLSDKFDIIYKIVEEREAK